MNAFRRLMLFGAVLATVVGSSSGCTTPLVQTGPEVDVQLPMPARSNLSASNVRIKMRAEATCPRCAEPTYQLSFISDSETDLYLRFEPLTLRAGSAQAVFGTPQRNDQVQRVVPGVFFQAPVTLAQLQEFAFYPGVSTVTLGTSVVSLPREARAGLRAWVSAQMRAGAS